MCKLIHDEEGIPEYLCRECHPELNQAKAPAVTVEAPAIDPAIRATIIKHRIGKLRKEEKRLSKLIDDIGRRDPDRTRQLYAAIKIVEKEIDAERAKL